MVDRFWDEPQGCFYDTGHGEEIHIVRPKNVIDSVQPSGSSAAAYVLLRLARLTDNGAYEGIAAAAIRSVQELMVRYPSGFGNWLCALDFYLSKPREIAIVGRPGDPATKSLIEVINLRYLPNKVLAGKSSETTATNMDIPLLQGRVSIENRPTVYVCESYACQAPVTDPDALAALLDRK